MGFPRRGRGCGGAYLKHPSQEETREGNCVENDHPTRYTLTWLASRLRKQSWIKTMMHGSKSREKRARQKKLGRTPWSTLFFVSSPPSLFTCALPFSFFFSFSLLVLFRRVVIAALVQKDGTDARHHVVIQSYAHWHFSFFFFVSFFVFVFLSRP